MTKKYSRIVFIDPGTNLGWACCSPRAEGKLTIHSGSVAFPKDSGPRVAAFYKQLQVLTGMDEPRIGGPILLVWEEAAFGQFGRADRMYGTWEGLLLLFCETYGVEAKAINQSTLKAYIREQGFYLGAKERKLLKPKDRKPKPRPKWKLTSPPKMQEHEIDARWGLEYTLANL